MKKTFQENEKNFASWKKIISNKKIIEFFSFKPVTEYFLKMLLRQKKTFSRSSPQFREYLKNFLDKSSWAAWLKKEKIKRFLDHFLQNDEFSLRPITSFPNILTHLPGSSYIYSSCKASFFLFHLRKNTP